MAEKDNISLMNLFLVMVKIGAFTIGGGYAMILAIEREITSRGWISKEDFPDLIALSQSAPGLLAVNISIFTGYRLKGTKGAIVATIGSCLPPFLVILLIALFFSGYADEPVVRKVFAGMRPAVVALIAIPMIKMGRRSCRKWWQWVIALTAMLVVAFLKISPVYILITVIVLGFSITALRDRKEGEEL